MSVESITKYRQLDGREILKVKLRPTKKYPNGSWFYVDACFEDLVKSKSWHINDNGYVVAVIGSKGYHRTLRLHREIAFKCLGRYLDYIDHENGLEFDNIGLNLTEVTSQQNQRNKQSRGYSIGKTYKSGGSQFQPTIKLNGKTIRDTSVHREDEACLKQFQFESENYTDYRYDFFKDRRGDLDIVDLERTGQILSDYATYLHVKRYIENNAWYAYRYNLFEYCNHHGIIIPKYELNAEGRIIDPVTKKILCPYG